MISTHDVLHGFWKKHFRPDNMVVVGISVDHESFVSMVEKYFQFSTQSSIITPFQHTYSNGDEILCGGQYHVNMEGMQFCQVELGLHCGGWEDKSM